MTRLDSGEPKPKPKYEGGPADGYISKREPAKLVKDEEYRIDPDQIERDVDPEGIDGGVTHDYNHNWAVYVWNGSSFTFKRWVNPWKEKDWSKT